MPIFRGNLKANSLPSLDIDSSPEPEEPISRSNLRPKSTAKPGIISRKPVRSYAEVQSSQRATSISDRNEIKPTTENRRRDLETNQAKETSKNETRDQCKDDSAEIMLQSHAHSGSYGVESQVAFRAISFKKTEHQDSETDLERRSHRQPRKPDPTDVNWAGYLMPWSPGPSKLGVHLGRYLAYLLTQASGQFFTKYDVKLVGAMALFSNRWGTQNGLNMLLSLIDDCSTDTIFAIQTLDSRKSTLLHEVMEAPDPQKKYLYHYVKSLLLISRLQPLVKATNFRGDLPLHVAAETAVFTSTEGIKRLIRIMDDTEAVNQYNLAGLSPLAISIQNHFPMFEKELMGHSIPGRPIATGFGLGMMMEDETSRYKLLRCLFPELQPGNHKFWKLLGKGGATIMRLAIRNLTRNDLPRFEHADDLTNLGIVIDAMARASIEDQDFVMENIDDFGMTFFGTLAAHADFETLSQVLRYFYPFRNKIFRSPGERFSILNPIYREMEMSKPTLALSNTPESKKLGGLTVWINKPTVFGSPFFLASTRGHPQVADLLVQFGAEESRFPEFCGLSPTEWAAGFSAGRKDPTPAGITKPSNYNYSLLSPEARIRKKQERFKLLQHIRARGPECFSRLLPVLAYHYFTLMSWLGEEGDLKLAAKKNQPNLEIPVFIQREQPTVHATSLYAYARYLQMKQYDKYIEKVCDGCGQEIGGQEGFEAYVCAACPGAEFCWKCRCEYNRFKSEKCVCPGPSQHPWIYFGLQHTFPTGPDGGILIPTQEDIMKRLDVLRNWELNGPGAYKEKYPNVGP